MGCVDGEELVDGFEFDEDFVFDDQIGAEATFEGETFVGEWDFLLRDDLKAGFG